MTRLFTCGWETGSPNEIGVLGAGPVTVVSTVPTPRTPGSYCLKVSSGSGADVDISLGAAKLEIWMRFGVLFHALAVDTDFAGLYDSDGSTNGSFVWNYPSGQISAWMPSPGATLLGTTAFGIPQDEWHTLEIRWQATSTTAGVTEIWVDNQRWLNFIGDNVYSARTPFTGAVRLGASLGGTGRYIGFDDLAINDTNGSINNGQIGDGRVVLLRPTGAGSTTELSRGGTDTGANWSQTSELPPSMSQFVYESSVGRRDLYSLSDLPAGTWTINTVEALLYGQASDAGAASLGPTIKSGGTTAEGAPMLLPTSPTYVRNQWQTDPNTTAGWTPTTVNAVELGATVR